MDKLYKGKPLYNAVLEYDYEGIMKISLVEEPAVMVDFITLSKQEELKLYSVENEEQKMLLGVVMVADTPIYRISPSGEEYYIQFSKDMIKSMAEKFILDGNANKINLQHTEGTDVDTVNMVEFYIKDVDNGISPKGFENVPNGSLFAKYKVNDDVLWDEIKKGTFKGFSLEGFFSMNVVEEMDEETQLWSDILDMLKQLDK